MAVGSEFIADSLKDPSEDDTSGWALAGLHTVQHYKQNYEAKIAVECGYLRSHKGLLPGQPPFLAIFGGG